MGMVALKDTSCSGMPWDNNKQWIKVDMTGKTSYKVTPPLDFTCFAGCVTDNGTGRYPYGFNPGNLICYCSGSTGTTNCHIIMTGVA